MTRGVLYFLAGKRHWVVLTVSLMSLREHWAGPVGVIIADDDGAELFEFLKEDGRLGQLIPVQLDMTKYRRHGAYMNKPKMIEASPFESTVFLDADTAVVKSLDPLFITPHGRVRLTRYSDWTTQGRKISGRIQAWAEVAPELVAKQLESTLPAINTGVVAFGSGEQSINFGEAWKEMVVKRPSFIADEIAAQLIWMDHGVEIVDDRWNCSPLYGANKADVCIWHFHGKKHLRSEAIETWWPLFLRAIKKDVARIRSWVPAGDRRLSEYLKQKGLDYGQQVPDKTEAR